MTINKYKRRRLVENLTANHARILYVLAVSNLKQLHTIYCAVTTSHLLFSPYE